MEYTIEQVKEIAQISAIMSSEIYEDLYKKRRSEQLIALWAIEFYNKFEVETKTNWEEILEEGYFPKSNNFRIGKTMDLNCWDDVVIDYAYYKLENL